MIAILYPSLWRKASREAKMASATPGVVLDKKQMIKETMKHYETFCRELGVTPYKRK